MYGLVIVGSRTVQYGRIDPAAARELFIRRALVEVREHGLQVTDDTAACELIGQPVKLVAGTTPNPKVTVHADLAYIEMLLRG